MVKKASEMSAAELKADKFVHYRTIQTGFLKMWDSTGQSQSWYNSFDPKHYAFKLPRMDLVDEGLKNKDEEIGVGRPVKSESFKMMPLGSKSQLGTLGLSEDAVGSGGGGVGSAEYAKKMLFSWALAMDPTDTASKMGGRTLREYEKPDRTKSGLGQFKGVNMETGKPTQRKTGPLPMDKQLKKFYWSTLSSRSGYALKGGGKHWGADQNTMASQGNKFRGIYEDSTQRPYSLQANFYSHLAMRSLLKMLGNILTIKKSGKKELGTDSPEELMIAIAGNEIEQWNSMSRSEIEAEMAQMMKTTEKLRAPSKYAIDIPVGSPAMERVIKTITETTTDAEQVKAAIRKGGLEVTEQYGRLKDMYDPLPSSGPEDFMRYSATEIKRDIYNKYTQGGNYVRPGKERTIGEQFFDRKVGRGGFEVLTWSEPVFKGVAFFSIFIPSELTSEDSVGVVTHFEPGMKSVGEAVMRSRGITHNVDTVRRAARSILHGGIVHTKTKTTIAAKQLGTHAMKWKLWKDFGVFTRVDISAPEDVAIALDKLVRGAARNLGNMISIEPNNTFTNWVQKQQEQGEKFAGVVHHDAGARWRGIARMLGPQAKAGTSPQDAINWPQPIHPRPFLWMTAAGQSIGSREAILK
tara:strand:+ start:266 stop:2167 length:1902 start_codon:yes stop_codon:yes gene_type:complete